MPVNFFSFAGMSSASQQIAQRIRNAIVRQGDLDYIRGKRDREAPLLPPINWQSGALATRANGTAYSTGQVVLNAAGLHQFICSTGGTTAGAEPAGLTAPGNAAATPWGCAPIGDNTAAWLWYGGPRTASIGQRFDYPAVSIPAALPASLTATFTLWNNPQSIFQSGGVSVLGKSRQDVASYSNVVPLASGSNIGATDAVNAYNQGNGQAVTFYTDAPLFALGIVAGAAQVAAQCQTTVDIDDKRVSDSPIIVPVAINPGFVVLDFRAQGRRPRKVRIQGPSSNIMWQVYTTPQDEIWFPDNAFRYRLMCIGNSFLGGAAGGAFFAGDRLCNDVAQLLGCDDVWEDQTGGTGFLAPGVGYNLINPNRLIVPLQNSPDAILAYGQSDQPPTFTPGQIQSAVSQWISEIRNTLPSTLIWVSGVFPSDTGPSANAIAAEQAIQQAVQATGDAATCFIPICTDPQGSWISGTGNLGATTGVGNADVMILADATHPTIWGKEFVARRLANRMRRSLLA